MRLEARYERPRTIHQYLRQLGRRMLENPLGPASIVTRAPAPSRQSGDLVLAVMIGGHGYTTTN